MVAIVRTSHKQNCYMVGARARGPFYGFAVMGAGTVDLYYYDYTGFDLEKSFDLEKVPYFHIGTFRNVEDVKRFSSTNPNNSIPVHIYK